MAFRPYILLAVFLASAPCHADVYINDLFTDHMVLQAAHPDAGVSEPRFYGTAGANETVEITFSSQHTSPHTYVAKPSGPEGGWSVSIDSPDLSAGQFAGPFSVEIVATTPTGETVNRVNFSDVYFGEVFVCAGQSNMELTLRATDNYTAEAAAADRYPNIRMFSPVHGTADAPVDYNYTGAWTVAHNDTVGAFSAVCYMMGRHLADHLGPNTILGLIETVIGGTTVHHWAPPEVGIGCNSTGMLPSKGEAAQYPPGWCWNRMVHPIAMNGTGFSVRQVAYYQGEADSGENDQFTPPAYACEMSNLVRFWRHQFGNEKLPFIIIQLPGGGGGCDPHGATSDEYDVRPGWKAIQWAQELAYRELDHTTTGLVTATDQGCCGLHFGHKSELARRLALWSRDLTFGDTTAAPRPPSLQFAAVESRSAPSVVLHFENAAGLHLQPAFSCDKLPRCIWPTKSAPLVNSSCCNASAPNIVSVRLDGFYYASGRHGKVETHLWGWVPANITIRPSNGTTADVIATPILPLPGTKGWPEYYNTYLGSDTFAVREVALMLGGDGCSLANENGMVVGAVGYTEVVVTDA